MMNNFFTMSKVFAFTLILGCISNAWSQKVVKGVPIKATSKYDPNIVADDEKRVYVVAETTPGKYFVEAYDKKKMNRLYTVELQRPYVGKKRATMESFTFLGGNFVVFYNFYDKKTHEYELFAKIISGKDGKTIKERKTLSKIVVERKRRKGDFSVVVSGDHSKIFLRHKAYYKAEKKNKTKYTLLDEDLEEIFEKELDDKEYEPYGYILDNDGSIYYLRSTNTELFVGSFDADKDFEAWEEEIELDVKGLTDYALTGFDLNINAKNELTITGLVSKGERFGSKKKRVRYKLYGGVFVSIDNESKEVKIAEVTPFEKKFFDQFKTASDIKKGKDASVSPTYSISNVYDKADGGVVAVYEEYFYLITSDQNGNTISEHITYGSLVVVDYSADGKVNSAHRINKRQVYYWSRILGGIYATSRGLRVLGVPSEWKTVRHFSYSCSFIDNKLVIMYNDYVDNIEGKTVNDRHRSFKHPKKANLVKVEIDLTSGKKTTRLFNEVNDKTTIFCPQDDYQREQGSDLILFGIKGSKYRYYIVR